MSTNNNEQLLAAALSTILGKEILSESNVPQQSQQHINKVSLFDQHLTSLVYGKVGIDDSTNDNLFITLHITILSNQKTFQCQIERSASVTKLKQIVYENEGITCDKQNLIYCGQEIDEGHLLSEYDIQDSGEIYVVRLRAMNSNDILVLDDNSRDKHYDYDFTNVDDKGKSFTRAGIEYRRPCGSIRFAIKVAGKFENEKWLGSNDGPDEWPVSYHGTRHDAAKSIAQTGFDLTKHKRFLFGRGVYSTPDINTAKMYAPTFTFNGEQYCIVFQNRVNPKTLIKIDGSKTKHGDYWISPSADDIRPYGYCIMKKK
ncbi:unnamed protein product [Adineta steineri]|uniref:Ubiquitin-like domain-containing protein n=1 Tax=Adineta steineri TaxID=433720 RepID=A0A814CZT0_9BILA|nr:unnamed protein product [Adineta steineri]CAF0988203.1 unnamed protein product [Adineta steineri]CAF1031750.1 unnamed protein product [Adineta steineri]CAF3842114.1 unnamed protein product [Adineta steineri]CAF4062407.1 unnamed protein product [Adineta steineri]